MYLEKFKLDGRLAVVTGAGQGNWPCLRGGARRRRGRKSSLRTAIRRRPRPAAPGSAPAATPPRRYPGCDGFGAGPEVADQLAAKHGKVDILVNNAGIARSETAAGDRRRALAERHRRQSQRHVLVLPRLRQAHADASPAPSSISARCPASSSTSRRSSAITTPPRPQCTISPSRCGRVGRPRRPRQRRGADLHRTPLNAFA